MTPPTTAELQDPELRLLNVRSPWAEEIVDGVKNVENRPNALVMNLDSWCLVVNSKNTATKKEIADLRRRRVASGLPPGSYNNAKTPKGAIIGAVKFRGSYGAYEMPLQSTWYNGGSDKGWVVKQAYRFKKPVRNVKGSLSLRFLSRMPEEERGRIVAELTAQLEDVSG